MGITHLVVRVNELLSLTASMLFPAHQPCTLRRLYICTVFCIVFLLRNRGYWLGKSQVLGSRPFKGMLHLMRVAPADRQRFGPRAMTARLLDSKTASHSVTNDLQWARVLQAKEGGIMIEGKEQFFKGLKSPPIECLQTWWCIVDHEPGFAALERMRAPSGLPYPFHPDHDDTPG